MATKSVTLSEEQRTMLQTLFAEYVRTLIRRRRLELEEPVKAHYTKRLEEIEKLAKNIGL